MGCIAVLVTCEEHLLIPFGKKIGSTLRKMLLANRFLSGHEVAEVLKHYESLTGMATWYD